MKTIHDKRKPFRLPDSKKVSEDDLRALYINGGVCAICGLPEIFMGRRHAVDHCHQTGKIRGLLCNHCNSGLGMFRENIEIMKKAIDYLQEGGVSIPVRGLRDFNHHAFLPDEKA